MESHVGPQTEHSSSLRCAGVVAWKAYDSSASSSVAENNEDAEEEEDEEEEEVGDDERVST